MELTIKNVRLAFPDLFVPTAFQEGQTKKYGATFLIEKNSADIKAIEEAIEAVAKEKWGKDAEKVLKSLKGDSQKFCFVDGDSKDLDGYAGCMALSAKTERRPAVVDRDATPLTEADGKPYPGCYVVAKIDIWAQQNAYGKGIRASLRGIQFAKDGDSFTAGSVASANEFEDLSVEDDDVSALA